MDQLTPEQVKQLCEQAIKDPIDFATNAANLPPQLVHHLHTMLITTLMITVKKQEETFVQIAAALAVVKAQLDQVAQPE